MLKTSTPPRLLYFHDGKARHHGVDLVVYHQLKGLLDAGFAVDFVARGAFDLPGLRNFPLRLTPPNLLSWTSYEIYYCLQRRWAAYRASRRLRAASRTDSQPYAAAIAFNYVAAALDLNALAVSGVPLIVNAPNQHHATVPQHTLRGAWPRITGDHYDACYTAATCITTLSGNAHESFLRAGIPDTRLRLISGGYDPAAFSPPNPPSSSGNRPFRLVFCGKLSHRKGAMQMLRAWNEAALTNAEFLIIGNLFDDVRSALAGLDLSGVRFLGHQSDVAPHLRSADVQILLSDDEGLPKSLIEGAACGLATICTRATGFPVEEMGNGFHVERDDTTTTARRIRELAQDPALRQRLGAAGASYVRREFSWETYRIRYAEMITGVLSGSS